MDSYSIYEAKARFSDLWHVACALSLDPTAAELAFITLDVTQRKVAAAVGFATPR
jgi:hypothetical protein